VNGLVAIALLAPLGIVAQQPAFRAETRLVVLHATVRNARGELATTLPRDAFTVYENGKRQPIALFRRDDIPVSLGLLIDNSGSMRTLRAKVEAAALALVRASNPQDEVFVLNFNDKARIDVPMTSDVGVLEAGIARVDSIGGTAMRDAIELAQAYLSEHASRERKVLLVITDGIDNASVATRDRIEKQAEERDTVIFAMGLFGNEERVKQGRHELDRLAERTGGMAYYPAGLDETGAVALEIARQIRNQYTIAYAPLNQALDGTYRTIRVAAAGAEHLSVRTRAGYFATPRPRPNPGDVCREGHGALSPTSAMSRPSTWPSCTRVSAIESRR
jgi:Ca-activated chloride channel homolog